MDVNNIKFDLNKNPSIEFDIFPLEEVLNKNDYDHDPRVLHRVHFYVLLVITAGKGKHTIDFKDHAYGPRSVVTIRKDQIHCFHRSDAKGFILLFTEEYLLSYLEQSEAQKIVQLFNELLCSQLTHLNPQDTSDILGLTGQIQKEFIRDHDDQTASIIRNFLQVLVSKLYRLKSDQVEIASTHKYTSQFLTFQRLVEQNCTRSKSVQDYAQKMNVTTRTLNNITHHIARKSAKAFIDEILIMQIKRMLINSKLSVKEVAYASGFDEPTNLFKFFKKNTGQTPEAFRNAH